MSRKLPWMVIYEPGTDDRSGSPVSRRSDHAQVPASRMFGLREAKAAVRMALRMGASHDVSRVHLTEGRSER